MHQQERQMKTIFFLFLVETIFTGIEINMSKIYSYFVMHCCISHRTQSETNAKYKKEEEEEEAREKNNAHT